VKRIYHELGGKKCAFSYFTQRDNKESRIFSNAHTVNSQIIMPDDWFARYPKFYHDVTRFLKVYKKNEYFDAPDTLTGIVERSTKGYGQYYYGT
jgi:predicted phage terminase large subunit-like protein